MKNVTLLKQVRDHILAEPKRLYMNLDIVRAGSPEATAEDTPKEFPACGTMGCIAGWTCLLAYGMDYNGDTFADAKQLYGIEEDQSEVLFWGDLDRKSTPQDAAFIAAKIDKFIEDHQ